MPDNIPAPHGAHANWAADSVNEFKKLPPAAKIGVAVGVAVVVFLGYRAATSGGGTGSATTAGANAGGLQSPFGSVPNASGNGSAPVVPFGDTPIFDSLGNLLGWQMPATSSQATTTTSTTPTPTKTTTPVPTPGGPFHGTPINAGPIVQKITPTATPGRAQPRLSTYTVVHGDNLSSIAARNHVQGGWQSLYNANKGVVGGNPNLIKPGQKLVIPGR